MVSLFFVRAKKGEDFMTLIKKWHRIENRGMDGDYVLFGDNR